MGIFSGIENVVASGKTPYVEPGMYKVRVEACKNVDGHRGNFFIVEMEVLESSNPERMPGSIMSWSVKLDKAYLATALGDVKAFVQAATMDASVSEDDILEACSPENPLKGSILRINAFNTKTKAGKDYTKLRWSENKE